MDYTNLKKLITDNVYNNLTKNITGQKLQDTLLGIVDSLAFGMIFKGVIVPSSINENPDENVFYLASQKGTYSNFGFTIAKNGIHVVRYQVDHWIAISVYQMEDELGDSDILGVTQNAVKKAVDTNKNLITDNRTDINQNYYDISVLNGTTENTNKYISDVIEPKIDGKIESYFQPNDPSIAWTTPDLKTAHHGDMWYNTTTGAKSLKRYNSVNGWELIEDQKSIDAYDKASTAQDTADNKRRTFIATPTTPYDVGDLWTQGKDGDLMYCQTSKDVTHLYSPDDWIKASKYTDDAAAEAARQHATDLVDGLEIGGRNLLLGTSSLETDLVRETNTLLASPILNGEIYTYSFYAYGTKADTPVLVYMNDNTGASRINVQPHFTIHITDTKTHYTGLFDSVVSDNSAIDNVTFRVRCVDVADRIKVSSIKLEKGNKATDWTPAPEDVEALSNTIQTNLDNYIVATNSNIANLQSQLDGEVDSWFFNYSPTTSNVPASDWTTTELKDQHIGDTFTNTTEFIDETQTPDAGKSWRWVVNGGVYSWTVIADSDAVRALLKASEAQDTADSKRRVFVETPVSPYDVGDLWTQGANGDLMRCITAKATIGDFSLSDWQKASKYTDDTKADEAKQHATDLVDDLEFGGRNLIIKSQLELGYFNSTGAPTPSNQFMRSNIFLEKPNFKVIASVNGSKASGTYFYIFFYDLNKNFINYTLHTNAGLPNVIDFPSNCSFYKLQFRFAPHEVLTLDSYGTTLLPKLEKGNKATDWTPAPEDVDKNVDDKIDAIEVGGTNLLINNELIQGATSGTNGVFVSGSTYITSGNFIPLSSKEITISAKNSIYKCHVIFYDNLYSFISSTYKMDSNNYLSIFPKTYEIPTNTTYFKVTIKKQDDSSFTPKIFIADGKLKIEKGNKATDWTPAPEDVEKNAQDLVDNVEVGGRNYLTKSDFETHLFAYRNSTTVPMTHVVNDGVMKVTALSNNGISNYTTLPKTPIHKNVILGMDIRSNVNCTLAPNYYSSISTNQVTTEWNRIYCYYDLNNTRSHYELATTGTFNTNDWIEIKNAKIEYGTKPTDYTPAQEDIDAKIYKNETDISKNATAINIVANRFAEDGSLINSAGLVTTADANKMYAFDVSGHLVSFIEQTASTIKINAQYLQLEGLTTINDKFKVLTDGSIEGTDAKISGEITATSGNIGGWNIDSDSIYHGTKHTADSFTTGVNDMTFHNGNLLAHKTRIYNGEFYTTDGHFSGEIEATSGTIGGIVIQNDSLGNSINDIGVFISKQFYNLSSARRSVHFDVSMITPSAPVVSIINDNYGTTKNITLELDSLISTADNIAINIKNGKVVGFNIPTKKITSDDILSEDDAMVFVVSSSVVDITLPLLGAGQDGHIYYVKIGINGSPVNVYPSAGAHIYSSNGTLDYDRLNNAGEMVMYIYNYATKTYYGGNMG